MDIKSISPEDYVSDYLNLDDSSLGEVEENITKMDDEIKNISLDLDKSNNSETALVSENKEIKSNPEISSELIKINNLMKDYDRVREIILENIEQSREVAKLVQTNIYNGEETADYISSYTNLISTINTSLKILTSSYKDISDTLLKIKKLESNATNVVNEVTNNTQINIISTNDVIEQLKKLKGIN